MPRPPHQGSTAAHDDSHRQLLEAAPDPVFLIGLHGKEAGRILDANTLAATVHGYTHEELLTMRVGDLDDPTDADRVPERLALLREHGFARFTVTHRRKDGSRFPVEVTARIGSVNGRQCVVAFNRDISESRRTLELLEVERTRLSLAARAGFIGFWDWDVVSDTVYFSPEWKAQIGYEPHELQPHYREWEQRVHPDDLPATLGALRRHLAGDPAPFEHEFRLRHRDGSWRWIHVRGQVMRDAAGNAARMLGCHVDVTSQHSAAEARAETESLLRSFYEGPGVLRGVVELEDDDIRHVTGNAEAARFFGCEIAAMDGRLASELGAPREAIRLWLEHYRRCELEGRPISFDYEHVTAEGARHLFCTVSHSADSEHRFVFAAFDRSEQKRARAAAAVADDRLRAVYEADPHCIKTVDAGGTVLDMNPAGLAMLGMTNIEQVRGRPTSECVHPEDRERVAAVHARVLAGGSEHCEYRVRGANGVRQVTTQSVPLRDATGAITSVLSVTRDVTDEREAERQRAAMQQRMEHLQQLEAIGTLSGGIAHDFNNLLAVIGGNLQLAEMQPGVPAGFDECLGEIRKATDRACLLVKQILTFARRHEPERRVLDFGAVAEEAARFLRATNPATIAIDLAVAPSLPATFGDATQLHQVIVNLGTNGCQAMEGAGGRLGITVDSVSFAPGDADRPAEASEGLHLRLRVTDSGVGMDATTLAHVFEPFFTTKPCGKGTGLGLSVVHGIVQNHGGCITVRSAPGAGTQFEVLLPVVPPASPLEATREAETPARAHRVLLVDDEPGLLRSTQRLLEHAGHTVTTCADPHRALELLAADPSAFDVLVTDHEMPEQTGLDLARRARELVPGLPTVLCSGFLRPAVAAELESEVGITVVQKPASPRRLSAAMDVVLAGRVGAPGATPSRD